MSYITTTETAHSATLVINRECPRQTLTTALRQSQGISTTMAGQTSSSPATQHPACYSTTTTTERSRKLPSKPAWPTTKTGGKKPVWVLMRWTTTATAG